MHPVGLRSFTLAFDVAGNRTYCTSLLINFEIVVSDSHEPVSWSSEEISVSRGNFLGKIVYSMF